MLLAYIDEIGEPGAFVSPTHTRFRTSPAFGYAGFIIPEDEAREFGSQFTQEKRNRFGSALKPGQELSQLEVKGASLFRTDTPEKRPENLRIFSSLVRNLQSRGGYLFYYADEKAIGTPKQTQVLPEDREFSAMQETLNRIARHADYKGENVLVTIDSINEKQRAARVAKMYQHIFARSSEHKEMRRLLEPPMHLDSKLSSNIQFADWVAGYITRAIDRQLIEDSKFLWVGEHQSCNSIKRTFTYESKLHYYKRSIDDLNHSSLVHVERPLFTQPQGQFLASSIPQEALRKLRAAAERNNSK